MIVNVENPMESVKSLLELKDKLSKVKGARPTYINQSTFLYANNKHEET